MIFENQSKSIVKNTAEKLSNKLIKQPLFMYFCQDLNKRQKFIRDYFLYHIPIWQKNDTILTNDKTDLLITLVDPANFEFKYKGLNQFKMTKYAFSSYVFMHRENLENICDIILPYRKPARVMTIYNNPELDFEEAQKLIDEAIKMADEKDVTLVYETFSRKYIGYMEHCGFVVAYQKQYLSTQFVETVMTYNM